MTRRGSQAKQYELIKNQIKSNRLQKIRERVETTNPLEKGSVLSGGARQIKSGRRSQSRTGVPGVPGGNRDIEHLEKEDTQLKVDENYSADTKNQASDLIKLIRDSRRGSSADTSPKNNYT